MATQERWEADTGGGVSHIIKRPRLTKILDESEARIILLCAPAGYGKTTLAREWVATRSEPVLWYSGGPAMADVAALAVDLAELFAGPESELVEKVRFLAARAESPTGLAKLLVRGIDDHTAPGALVVIDDYQCAARASDADIFLRATVELSHRRFVITTRRRPNWLDARSFVYGSAIVLGARELAFTVDETSSLLPGGTEVQQLADGWPVLIGLAAARGPEAMSIDAPAADLFDFFATDLLSSADQALQRSLLILAACGDVPLGVARELLGADADRDIVAATAYGFLPPGMNTHVEMHPLLRAFLLRHFACQSPETLAAVAEDVQSVLIKHSRWDQCLDLLESVPDDTTAVVALEHCLVELLDSGRVATVRRWADFARRRQLQQAIFLLTEAELSIRSGEGEAARSLAKHAAHQLDGRLKARAHLAAARAAHLCYGDDVVEHTTQAAASTDDEQLRQEALWLAFLAAYERQDEDTETHLERLCSLRVDDIDLALRAACARGIFSYEGGRLGDALAIANEARPLFERARNPLIRTNFLNLFAHCLVVTAQYDEAISVAEIEAEDAARGGLEFVVAYALLTRASSEIGMRRLRNARSTLAQLRRFAPKPDGHISGNIAIADAKLAIAGGDLKRAAAALQHVPTTNVSPGFTGEFLAYRGLVQAAAGDLSRAEATYSESQSVSRYVDSVSAQTIGEAIMLAQSPGSPGEYVRAKVQSVVDIGHRDMVLTGCRAYPQLAAICVESGELRKALSELFETSRDFDLARSAGIVVPRAHRRGDSLSSREEEILDLLSQGRTNRQIAETLFISESTAKVHVRHIFEKLGVHSRVEAVAWLQEMD